jgi:spermidine/putrescine transport system ATP-binding protein
MPDASPGAATRAGERPVAVEVRGLVRRFGDFTALDHVDLVVREGEFFSLLGPSGCGKTTLLRILAGLDVADAGGVAIFGQDALPIPAHRRPVNTVFQSYALFPHLSVRDNVAFGLRIKKVPEAQVSERVHTVIELVQIGAFADRKPAQLSGGQKQRVALARALVNEPKVLLLDEPLGALDLKLRKELQVELLALQRRLGITFIFVTHDQEEALVMSDRIAVMRAGRIEQLGEAEAIYERPRTRFVGSFLGSCNFFSGRVVSVNAKELVIDAGPGTLRAARTAGDPEPGAEATLAIRPEKVTLVAPGELRENVFPARVEEVIYIGSESHYILSSPFGRLTVYVMNSVLSLAELDLGDEIEVFLPPSALVTLEET